MGWSTHHPVGLIHYSPQHCYRGYTLFATNRGGYHANLIDMEGRVCHRWHSTEGIAYCYLLPNGNLLLRTSPPCKHNLWDVFWCSHLNRNPRSAGIIASTGNKKHPAEGALLHQLTPV